MALAFPPSWFSTSCSSACLCPCINPADTFGVPTLHPAWWPLIQGFTKRTKIALAGETEKTSKQINEHVHSGREKSCEDSKQGEGHCPQLPRPPSHAPGEKSSQLCLGVQLWSSHCEPLGQTGPGGSDCPVLACFISRRLGWTSCFQAAVPVPTAPSAGKELLLQPRAIP